jgi:hypothetical protein
MVRRWRGQKRVRTYRNQLSLTLATRLAADPDMLECTSVRLYLWIAVGVLHAQTCPSCKLCRVRLEAPPSSPEAPVNMHASLRQGTGEVL